MNTETIQPPAGSSNAVHALDPKTIKTFSEFYPYYLTEHRNRTCRRLHFLGTSLVVLCVILFGATGSAAYLLAAPVCGYGFAWIGHFFFEKNKPASFKRPLYSLIGDFVMYRDIWLGKVKI